MSKRKLMRDIGTAALFVGAATVVACVPWSGEMERYGRTPVRVVMGVCALFFAAVIGWQVGRLVKEEPALVVDETGFHQRGRTIAWSDVRALGIDDAPGTRSRVRRLSVVPAAGRPIRVVDRQVDRPLAEVMTSIREWQLEQQAVAPTGPLAPARLLMVDVKEGLFAKVAFRTVPRGYDPAQVDLFLTLLGTQVEELQALWRSVDQRARQLETQLCSTHSNTELPTSDVEEPGSDGWSPLAFATTDHGYDTDDVEGFLHEAGSKIGQLQAMVRQAQARSASAEAQLAARASSGPI